MATSSFENRLPPWCCGLRCGGVLVALVAGPVAGWSCFRFLRFAGIGSGDDYGNSISQKGIGANPIVMPLRDRSTMQTALSTIAPFVFGLFATRVTMVVGDQYGMDTIPFVLFGWCVVLGISAAWLNWAVFRTTKTFIPFVAAVFVILLVWLWQRQAFTNLVPRSGLTYGYFLTPEGAKAGLWTLTCPFRVGLTCLSICFIGALVLAWRAGFRGLLACIIPWWLTAFLIFSLPSVYLDGQGNASIFI